jgi:hypothetical protein
MSCEIFNLSFRWDWEKNSQSDAGVKKGVKRTACTVAGDPPQINPFRGRISTLSDFLCLTFLLLSISFRPELLDELHI